MKYFAVQVQTLQEEKIISTVQKELLDRMNQQYFYFPKRLLKIRKAGKASTEYQPLFPGYLFLKTNELDTQLYNILRTTKGFIRFLPNNKELQCLSGHDLLLLEHFLRFGNEINSSKVFFDENEKINVLSGPLKGIEGLIIKVDKRKQRAKVKMEFSDNSIVLDLSFDVIEHTKNSDQNEGENVS